LAPPSTSAVPVAVYNAEPAPISPQLCVVHHIHSLFMAVPVQSRTLPFSSQILS
jgi:hypothetical protein